MATSLLQQAADAEQRLKDLQARADALEATIVKFSAKAEGATDTALTDLAAKKYSLAYLIGGGVTLSVVSFVIGYLLG